MFNLFPAISTFIDVPNWAANSEYLTNIFFDEIDLFLINDDIRLTFSRYLNINYGVMRKSEFLRFCSTLKKISSKFSHLLSTIIFLIAYKSFPS